MRKILLILSIFCLLSTTVFAQEISYFRGRARDGTIRWFDPLVPLPSNFESKDHNVVVSIRKKGEEYTGTVRFYSFGYLKAKKIIFRPGKGTTSVDIKYPVFMTVTAQINSCDTFSEDRVYCTGSGKMNFRGANMRSSETVEKFVLNVHNGVIDLEGGHTGDKLFSIAGMS